MRNLTLLFLGLITMMVFTQCSKPSVGTLVNNAETRGEIISELVKHPDYMDQVMDSMMNNHHGMQMMNMMMDKNMRHKGLGMYKSHSDGLMMMNGKMMIEHNGNRSLMNNEVTMKDGTKVRSNGTCLRMDGTKMMFQEGQHMNMSGKMLPLEDTEKK